MGARSAAEDNRRRKNLAALTMKELLEAGVHFGHQTKRWNPKMQKYIFGERNGIYIIDLQRSEEHTSEPQSRLHLVCRLLLEKKKTTHVTQSHNHVPSRTTQRS